MLSWKLLGYSRHFGTAVADFSETWGNCFKQKGFFSPQPSRFGALWMKPLAPGRSREHFAAGWCITSVSQRPWVEWYWAARGMSQQTPCVKWKLASSGCFLWVVERRWGLGHLLQEEGKLLWLPGRALSPALLQLQSGLQDWFQRVWVLLAWNVLTFFSLFFFLLFSRKILTWHHHAPGTSQAKACSLQIRPHAGDPAARFGGWFWFAFRLQVDKNCWSDYYLVVYHVVWTEADLPCRSHCKDKQEEVLKSQQKCFSLVRGAGGTANTEGELARRAGSCSAAHVSPGQVQE